MTIFLGGIVQFTKHSSDTEGEKFAFEVQLAHVNKYRIYLSIMHTFFSKFFTQRVNAQNTQNISDTCMKPHMLSLSCWMQRIVSDVCLQIYK